MIEDTKSPRCSSSLPPQKVPVHTFRMYAVSAFLCAGSYLPASTYPKKVITKNRRKKNTYLGQQTAQASFGGSLTLHSLFYSFFYFYFCSTKREHLPRTSQPLGALNDTFLIPDRGRKEMATGKELQRGGSVIRHHLDIYGVMHQMSREGPLTFEQPATSTEWDTFSSLVPTCSAGDGQQNQHR